MNEVQHKGPHQKLWERWVWLRALGVGGGVALLLGWFTFFASPGIFQGFEAELFDMRVTVASNVNEAPDPDELGIIIITIDDYSLGEIGEFRQWPRDIHGQLAQKLGDWGAATIFFDLLFTGDDTDPEVDRKLGDHFGSAGVVYNAISLIDRESFVYESAVEDWDWSVLENSPRSAIDVKGVEGAETLLDFAEAKVLDGPPLRLCRSSLALGMVNVVGDEDGVIRRQPLLFRYGDVLLPTVALRMFLDLLGVNRDELRIEPGVALHAGDYVIPIDAQGRYLLHWYPGEGPYRSIPYYDVLAERVPGEFFEGTICLVGPTAPGLGDIKSAPADRTLPGVYIHATLLANLIQEHTVVRMGPGLAILAMVLLGAVAAWFAMRFRITFGLLAATAIFLIGLFFTFYAYTRWAYWAELFRPSIGLVGGYTAAMAYRYFTEERQKRVVKGAFQQYVSPAVVDEMLLNPDKLTLGGERRELTVLFADIQGFTGFSEKLDPEELTTFLNRFLTKMSHVIFDHHGTVDKYIGDAIMAIFGAPLPSEDHAANGVRAALDMHKALKEFRQEWADMLPDTFDLKLGLNTGLMVVGNMGSDIRFDYTVLGDNVNLAARLEALTRQYGVSLLISEFTHEAVGGNGFLMRELDRVRVKGKDLPVTIYEVLAEEGGGDATPDLRQRIETFNSALHLYRSQQWDEALAGFQALHSDPAADVFADRCSYFQDDPPEADWDGVWVMKTK
jgi:adenylate cyclase